MNDPFTIRPDNGRTTAAINGLAPGGHKPLRPFIIPVFIPLSGCPHRCAFCNQTAITGVQPYPLSPAAVEQSVRACLPHVQDKNRPVQIAFFGGNFLGLPAWQVRELLSAATAFVNRKDAAGIRFSTRPDTITPESLATLRDFPIATIELGLQSMDDRVLAQNRRGHSAGCTSAAARLVKSSGYALVLQMMTGLPGDTARGAEQTAEAVIQMAPDAVRIYPTLVLENSLLARQFRTGAFIPASLEETVSLVSRLFLEFAAAGIPVIRMGLQADDALSSGDTVLAGPYHPAFGEHVYSRIFFNLAKAALDRHPDHRNPVVLRVHPRHLSRMIGVGRTNHRRLKSRFHIPTLSIRADARIGPHHLEVDNSQVPIASKSC
jgi:histone acetyltransferase (RNA polymerase elongator complex component)